MASLHQVPHPLSSNPAISVEVIVFVFTPASAGRTRLRPLPAARMAHQVFHTALRLRQPSPSSAPWALTSCPSVWPRRSTASATTQPSRVSSPPVPQCQMQLIELCSYLGGSIGAVISRKVLSLCLLPICMVNAQYSFSHNARLEGECFQARLCCKPWGMAILAALFLQARA